MELSAEQRKVARAIKWNLEAADEGDLVAGLDGLEPWTRTFPLEAPHAIESAAYSVHTLGFKVALPIFVLDPGTAPDASRVLRSHVAGCRFVDFDGADLHGLPRRPDRAVRLGHHTFALWRIEEVDGDDLAEIQGELHQAVGNDPSWSGSVLELFPLAGVTYEVGGVELEAESLKVAKL